MNVNSAVQRQNVPGQNAIKGMNAKLQPGP